MMKDTVYLLVQYWEHDGGECIAAFASKQMAYDMKAKCDEHLKLHPFNVDKYAEDYFQKLENWLSNHPIGEFVSPSVDGYTVNEVELLQ